MDKLTKVSSRIQSALPKSVKAASRKSGSMQGKSVAESEGSPGLIKKGSKQEKDLLSKLMKDRKLSIITSNEELKTYVESLKRSESVLKSPAMMEALFEVQMLLKDEGLTRDHRLVAIKELRKVWQSKGRKTGNLKQAASLKSLKSRMAEIKQARQDPYLARAKADLSARRASKSSSVLNTMNAGRALLEEFQLIAKDKQVHPVVKDFAKSAAKLLLRALKAGTESAVNETMDAIRKDQSKLYVTIDYHDASAKIKTDIQSKGAKLASRLAIGLGKDRGPVLDRLHKDFLKTGDSQKLEAELQKYRFERQCISAFKTNRTFFTKNNEITLEGVKALNKDKVIRNLPGARSYLEEIIEKSEKDPSMRPLTKEQDALCKEAKRQLNIMDLSRKQKGGGANPLDSMLAMLDKNLDKAKVKGLNEFRSYLKDNYILASEDDVNSVLRSRALTVYQGLVDLVQDESLTDDKLVDEITTERAMFNLEVLAQSPYPQMQSLANGLQETLFSSDKSGAMFSFAIGFLYELPHVDSNETANKVLYDFKQGFEGLRYAEKGKEDLKAKAGAFNDQANAILESPNAYSPQLKGAVRALRSNLIEQLKGGSLEEQTRVLNNANKILMAMTVQEKSYVSLLGSIQEVLDGDMVVYSNELKRTCEGLKKSVMTARDDWMSDKVDAKAFSLTLENARKVLTGALSQENVELSRLQTDLTTQGVAVLEKLLQVEGLSHPEMSAIMTCQIDAKFTEGLPVAEETLARIKDFVMSKVPEKIEHYGRSLEAMSALSEGPLPAALSEESSKLSELISQLPADRNNMSLEQLNKVLDGVLSYQSLTNIVSRALFDVQKELRIEDLDHSYRAPLLGYQHLLNTETDPGKIKQIVAELREYMGQPAELKKEKKEQILGAATRGKDATVLQGRDALNDAIREHARARMRRLEAAGDAKNQALAEAEDLIYSPGMAATSSANLAQYKNDAEEAEFGGVFDDMISDLRGEGSKFDISPEIEMDFDNMISDLQGNSASDNLDDMFDDILGGYDISVGTGATTVSEATPGISLDDLDAIINSNN